MNNVYTHVKIALLVINVLQVHCRKEGSINLQSTCTACVCTLCPQHLIGHECDSFTKETTHSHSHTDTHRDTHTQSLATETNTGQLTS